MLGTTLIVNVEPATEPEKWAGGGGLIEIGPTSIRYVPSTSNVPSLRIVGFGKCPCPHPAERSQVVSVTDRHALLPTHRPAANVVARGSVGVPQVVRKHAARKSKHRGKPIAER